MGDADDISRFLWSNHFFHLTPPPFLNRHSKTCRDGLETEGLVWIWNIGDDMIIILENICIFHFK
jgi:hypothetical protein